MPKAKAKETNSNYARWVKEAVNITATNNPLNVPYEVALTESIGLARFITKYWAKTPERPGLESVAKRLPQETSDDLVSVVDGIQYAQTQYLLIVDPAVITYGERARFVIKELEAALEFVLDDGVEEPEDQKLAKIKDFHSQNGQRSVALAQSARSYAELATSLKGRIVNLITDFDVSLIDEANKLTQELLKPQETHEAELASDVALATRNKLLHIMEGKKGLVRRTAAYVFRNFPDIVRESTSAYERRRRAEARRAKLEKEEAEASKPKEG